MTRHQYGISALLSSDVISREKQWCRREKYLFLVLFLITGIYLKDTDLECFRLAELVRMISTLTCS